MSQKAYFGQLEQNINSLIADKRYNEAHKLCIDFLNKYPNEKILIELKERIESAVYKENEKIVNAKIKEVKPLWKQEKYEEILKVFKPLLTLLPSHPKLNRLALKAQTAYKEEIAQLEEKFKTEQIKNFTKILNTSPDTLTAELNFFEKTNPSNPTVRQLVKEFKTKLIQKKIDEKQELIYSDKFDDIHNFIGQLKKIDEDSVIIKDLEEITKRRQFGSQINEKNEFIYRGKWHLITMMQLKKYDKVIQAAVELLEMDHNNKEVRKILKKAEKKYFSQNKNLTVDKISNEMDQIKQEYKKNPSSYKKI